MTVLTVRRYLPLDCDATVEIFPRAVREIASWNYAPAQINAWGKVEERQLGRSAGQAGQLELRKREDRRLALPIWSPTGSWT